MSNRLTACFCCCLLVAVWCACDAPRSSPPSHQPVQVATQQPSTPRRPEARVEVNPLLKGFTGGLPRGAEAWQRFTADGRYRGARAADFAFSEAARQSGGRDLDNYLAAPYMTGDIDRDYRSRDVAVMVVDTTRGDAGRFGLVIFTEPKEGDAETVPEPYWLYRERDLSRTMISWDSEGMNLRTYDDAGSFTLCRVKWDRQRRQYSCK